MTASIDKLADTLDDALAEIAEADGPGMIVVHTRDACKGDPVECRRCTPAMFTYQDRGKA